MTLEEVARDRPPLGGAPDTESFQKILRQEYLVNKQELVAEVPYCLPGEHDTREVAHPPPMGGAPDLEVVREILTQGCQVEISYFVSGEHDTRRGGTRSPYDGWCS